MFVKRFDEYAEELLEFCSPGKNAFMVADASKFAGTGLARSEEARLFARETHLEILVSKSLLR